MGYLLAAGGARVEFKTYENRGLILSDGDAQLTRRDTRLVFSENEWSRAEITVTTSGVVVKIGDRELLRWAGQLSSTEGQIAFTAATGASSSAHEIKDIVIDTAVEDVRIIDADRGGEDF